MDEKNTKDIVLAKFAKKSNLRMEWQVACLHWKKFLMMARFIDQMTVHQDFTNQLGALRCFPSRGICVDDTTKVSYI